MPLGFPLVDFIILSITRPALRLRDMSSQTLQATQSISYFIAQKFLQQAERESPRDSSGG